MEMFSVAFLLFLVMDPLGNIPMFITQLKHVDENRVTRIIWREALIALAILIGFLFAGDFILKLMHVSRSSLGIAGGIILFLISIQMIFGQSGFEEGNGYATTKEEPFIVPLAVPYIAGPSAMTMVILQMAKAPSQWPQWFGALVIAWAASTAILLCCRPISRVVGKKALTAVERLMGLLLTAISVEMFIAGIREALSTV